MKYNWQQSDQRNCRFSLNNIEDILAGHLKGILQTMPQK